MVAVVIMIAVAYDSLPRVMSLSNVFEMLSNGRTYSCDEMRKIGPSFADEFVRVIIITNTTMFRYQPNQM